jgi:MlaC protein
VWRFATGSAFGGGPTVSRLGFWRNGHHRARCPGREAIALLRRIVDKGVTFIDIALFAVTVRPVTVDHPIQRNVGSKADREGVIVSSRVQVNGGTPIRIDWRLNPTNHDYKVTDVVVNGISMASTLHSDLVSVIQSNNGHVQSLLIVMREKMRATVSSDNRQGSCDHT